MNTQSSNNELLPILLTGDRNRGLEKEAYSHFNLE